MDSSSTHFIVEKTWARHVWYNAANKMHAYYAWYNSDIKICMSGWHWLYFCRYGEKSTSYFYMYIKIDSDAPIPFPYNDDIIWNGSSNKYPYIRFSYTGPTQTWPSHNGYDPTKLVNGRWVERFDLTATWDNIQTFRNSWIYGVMNRWYGSANGGDYGADWSKGTGANSYAIYSIWLSNNDDDWEW